MRDGAQSLHVRRGPEGTDVLSALAGCRQSVVEDRRRSTARHVRHRLRECLCAGRAGERVLIDHAARQMRLCQRRRATTHRHRGIGVAAHGSAQPSVHHAERAIERRSDLGQG